MKKGTFIYKNEACMKKMHDFYDRSLAQFQVPYTEEYFDTSKTVVCPDGCVIFKLTAKPLGNENFHTGGFWDYPDETQ